MAIHREIIEGRDIVITVEEICERHSYRPIGFVARVASEYEDNSDGFIPYQGDFVKDDDKHVVIYQTEGEAHSAAMDYATRRLKKT